MTTRNPIFGNTYRDSVVLMRLSRELTAIDGIEEATAIMGTDNNKALLEQAELLVETGQNAGANDVIVAFRVSSQDTETSVASRIRELLESERSAVDGAREYRPKTLNGALAALPGANLAVISVPGEYAAYEASKALDRGLHVFLFSNNVSVEDEVSLKNRALDLGLVMLGPDCGTAIINNAPIGFTNAVPEGRVGLVSASGTGLQQVTCLLAAGGEGVSQAWGVGSRDLDDRVGGLMMLHGLRTLENDPASELVVLISKPPGPETQERVLAALGDCSKPCVVCFLGMEAGPPNTSNVFFETTLQGTATRVLDLLGGGPSPAPTAIPSRLLAQVEEAGTSLVPGARCIRGLYSGGTLCYESLLFLRGLDIDVSSNLQLTGVTRLDGDERGPGHVLLDLGDDRYTVGAPHPMIDFRQRCERIVREATDPQVGIMLLDVVLGYGAHPDPAAELGPALHEARSVASRMGRNLVFIVVLCGTVGDPQSLAKQQAELTAAGALVVPSNLQAVSIAAALSLDDLSLIN